MHYLFALLVPPLILGIGWRSLGSRRALAVLAMVSVFCTYATTVVVAYATSAWLQHELDAYDKNSDGIFSSDEQSEEQGRAMDLVTNDLGRNLTVFLAIPWAAGCSGLFFLPLAWVRGRRPGPTVGQNARQP